MAVTSQEIDEAAPDEGDDFTFSVHALVLSPGGAIAELPGTIGGVLGWGPDDGLVHSTADGQLMRWSPVAHEVIGSLPGRGFWSVGTSPDGRYLAALREAGTASEPLEVVVWDHESASLTAVFVAEGDATLGWAAWWPP